MYVYVDGYQGGQGSQHNNGYRVNGYYIEVYPKDKKIIINLEAGGSSSMTKIEMEREEAIKLVSKLLSAL
jgi:hypothetical protein